MKKTVKKKLKQVVSVVTEGIAVVAGVGGRRGRRRRRVLFLGAIEQLVKLVGRDVHGGALARPLMRVHEGFAR